MAASWQSLKQGAIWAASVPLVAKTAIAMVVRLMRWIQNIVGLLRASGGFGGSLGTVGRHKRPALGHRPAMVTASIQEEAYP